MEMSVMQSSGLRCLQSLQASTSGFSAVRPNKASSLVFGHRCFSSAKSVSTWKQVRDFGERQRSVRRASSGGTRRDQQKIVARTQKRRSRHVKGVTPTKDELLDQLAQEEQADEDLEEPFADIDEAGFEGNEDDLGEDEATDSNGVMGSAVKATAEDDTLVLQEKPSPPSERGEEQNSVGVESAEDLEKYWKIIENVNTENTASEDRSSEASQGIQAENEKTDLVGGRNDDITSSETEEIIENDDNTYTVRFAPDGDKGAARKQKNGVASNVQASVEQASSVVGEVSDVAQDIAKGVSDTAESTIGKSGENLQEAGDVVRGNVEERLDQAGSVVEELTHTAQETAEDVATTVRETTQDSGESLSEAGDAIRGGLSEVGSQGASIARETAAAVGEQLQERQEEAQDDLSEFGSQAEEVVERAGGGLEKIAAEAGKSAERVGDSLTTQVTDAAGTAGVIRGEALRLGEIAGNAVAEFAGFPLETGSASESGSKQGSEKKVDDSGKEDSKVEVSEVKSESTEGESQSSDGEKEEPGEAEKSEGEGPYIGLKVTVAGATGRTGRLIVEELVSRGVPVRAMVRDTAKARDLERMLNVEVVKADLYNYEAVRKALGDSNVVICAIGASGFPFDPIGTYQTEFEGVKNLVAAARNGGKVKKFVFITTIGVSFLQIVPLIFWKKQAELYLQRSGLDYTIIRPGGLKNGVDKGETVLMKPADSQFGGSITRRKVAKLCIDAVITSEASEKVVEVVSGGRGGQTPAELFGNV